MRHTLLALPLLLAATSAYAAWESGMVEDEGGEVMQAWVTAEPTEGEEFPPELRMMCGRQVNLRYSMPVVTGGVPTDDEAGSLAEGEPELVAESTPEVDVEGEPEVENDLTGSQPVVFTFDFGDDAVGIEMQYEEMDGAHAAYFARDALVIGYLRGRSSVSIDDPTGTSRPQSFTLEGSSKAIDAVLRTCRR